MTDSDIVKMMGPVYDTLDSRDLKTGLGQYLNKPLDSSSAFGAMIEGCTPNLEP